jgi:molecular chaperone GrpE
MEDVQQPAPSPEGLETAPTASEEQIETTTVPEAATGAESPADLRRERDDYRDLLLRKSAEFDNYRKRIDRERRDLADLAAADLIKELLPFIDNLERAVNAPAEEAGVEAFRRGVELIHRQMLEVLEKRGVQIIDPLGADFDPHLHEAVTSERGGTGRDGEVIVVFSRGYRLGDRLLRPAMVKVATA